MIRIMPPGYRRAATGTIARRRAVAGAAVDGWATLPTEVAVTFVMILLYAAFILAGLTALAAGFIVAGRWLIQSTHDPDAH
jgi:hypothetical protein